MTSVLERQAGRARGRAIQQEVEDLCQHVFVRLFERDGRALRAWRPDGGRNLPNFVRWFAVQQVAMTLRSGRSNPWTDDPWPAHDIQEMATPDAGPARRIEARSQLDALLALLQTELDSRQWQLFVLLFVEDRSVEEVCAETQLKPADVYQWRRRLRQRVTRLAATIE